MCLRAREVLSCSVICGFGVRCNCVTVPEALRIVCRRACAHWATATSGVGRRRTAGPFFGVRLRLKFLVDVQHAVAGTVLRVADLDIVVVPAELLVGLDARKEVGTAEEVADTSD